MLLAGVSFAAGSWRNRHIDGRTDGARSASQARVFDIATQEISGLKAARTRRTTNDLVLAPSLPGPRPARCVCRDVETGHLDSGGGAGNVNDRPHGVDYQIALVFRDGENLWLRRSKVARGARPIIRTSRIVCRGCNRAHFFKRCGTYILPPSDGRMRAQQSKRRQHVLACRTKNKPCRCLSIQNRSDKGAPSTRAKAWCDYFVRQVDSGALC